MKNPNPPSRFSGPQNHKYTPYGQSLSSGNTKDISKMNIGLQHRVMSRVNKIGARFMRNTRNVQIAFVCNVRPLVGFVSVLCACCEQIWRLLLFFCYLHALRQPGLQPRGVTCAELSTMMVMVTNRQIQIQCSIRSDPRMTKSSVMMSSSQLYVVPYALAQEFILITGVKSGLHANVWEL